MSRTGPTRVPPTPGPLAAVQRRVLSATLRRTIRPVLGNASLDPERRRQLLDAFSLATVPPRGTERVEGQLGGVPTWHLTVGRPATARHLLFLHGGGYFVGGLRSHGHLCERLAGGLDATAHLVRYRLAPEHPYPAAVDDALAAYRGLLDDGVRPQDLVVFGDSAGGGLLFALMLRLKELDLPQPAVNLAVAPWVDLADTAASHRERGERDVMLSPTVGDVARAGYAAGTPLDTPGLSPLFGDLGGLAPTLVQVGSEERLHDDAVLIAAALEQAGVEVVCEVWEQLWHDWHLHHGLLRDSDRAIEHLVAFVDARVPR